LGTINYHKFVQYHNDNNKVNFYKLTHGNDDILHIDNNRNGDNEHLDF